MGISVKHFKCSHTRIIFYRPIAYIRSGNLPPSVKGWLNLKKLSVLLASILCIIEQNSLPGIEVRPDLEWGLLKEQYLVNKKITKYHNYYGSPDYFGRKTSVVVVVVIWMRTCFIFMLVLLSHHKPINQNID